MSPIELTIAIAVGYAAGKEVASWLGLLTRPLYQRARECQDGVRTWRNFLAPQ